MAVTGAELIVKIQSDIADLKRGMGEAKKEVGGLSNSLKEARKVANVAGTAIIAGAVAIAAGLAVASKAALDFNKGLANINTMVGNNKERMNELKNGIQAMSVDMGVATSDLTDGAYQVISAFGDTADTIDILKIAAMGAKAGLASTTDAINLLSAVTKGYGDTTAESVKKVSDLAFQTVKLGQTTFPELAASIGRVTPLAAELGVTQEELFAVMATGTGVTGGAAEVSTQFRGVLQSLMAPTEDMTRLIKDLGYESGKSMLKQEGLGNTLQLIKMAAEQADKPLQKYIGSIEGQTLALALTGSQADVYLDKLEQMTESSGATAEAFMIQTEGINEVGFDLDRLSAQWTVFLQLLGDAFLPMLGIVANKLMTVLGDAANWVKENREQIQSWFNTTIKYIGMIVEGWLKMYDLLSSAADAFVEGIGLVMGNILKAFEWVLKKLGIEIPKIGDLIIDVTKTSDEETDKMTDKWNEFTDGLKKNMEETTNKQGTEQEKQTAKLKEETDKQTGIVGESAVEQSEVITEERKTLDESLAILQEAQIKRDEEAQAKSEEKKAKKAEKEAKKAQKEIEKSEKEHYKELEKLYGETLDENTLLHASHLQAIGEDYTTYLEEQIVAQTPTMWDKAFEGVAENFDRRIDEMGDMWVEDILHGNFKNAFDFTGDYIVKVFEAAFMDIGRNILGGFLDKVRKGLSDALAGIGKSFWESLTGGVGGFDIGDIFGVGDGVDDGADVVTGAVKGVGLATVGAVAFTVGVAVLAAKGIADILSKRKARAKQRATKFIDLTEIAELLQTYDNPYASGDPEMVKRSFDAALAEYGTDRAGQNSAVSILGAARMHYDEILGYNKLLTDKGLQDKYAGGISLNDLAIIGKSLNMPRFSYNMELQNEPPYGKFYNRSFSLHQGGIVPGIIGQEQAIMALAGEEVLTRSDPRHSTNFGGVVINITGNNINSELDMQRLAKVASDEIFRKLTLRTKVSRN